MNKTRLQGIFEERKGKRKTLFTKNLAPGRTVYDEKLVKVKEEEYRTWDVRKSKLAAAVLKNISQTGIKQGDVILYLGASTGTTASHISDIIGKDGFIFALDFAPRVVRELVFVCEERNNMTAILADANKPESYIKLVSQADIIYQDIAQKNQLEIFLKNTDLFLKKDGFALLCIKARSIDVTKNPKDIFREIKEELKKNLEIIDYSQLDPFQKDHCFFVCKKRKI